MLDEYAQGIPCQRANLRLLNLADEGTLRFATYAHDIVSWHFKMEELIFTVHDMGNKEIGACQRERVILKHGNTQSFKYYLGLNSDNSAIDIELVQCSCIPSVVKRLIHCSNTQTIRSEMQLWITEEVTANLRTPAILSLGGCCLAFASGTNPTKDSRELARFLDVFNTAARLPGQEHDADRQQNFIQDPWDLIFSDQHDVQSLNQRSRILILNRFTTGHCFEISVSFVAMANGNAIGNGRRKPGIVNGWLGIRFGRTLAIFDSEHQGMNM